MNWFEMTEEQRKDIIKRTLQIIKNEQVADIYKRFCELNPTTHLTLQELYDFYEKYQEDWKDWSE